MGISVKEQDLFPVKPSPEKSKGKKKKLKNGKGKVGIKNPTEEPQNIPDVPEVQVNSPVKENVGKKKKRKGGKKEFGSEKPSEKHEKVPDEHAPLEPEVKPSVKKSKGKKKKLKSGKKDPGSEKPIEEHQNVPDEQIPLVSEVKPSVKKSKGKKKKLKGGKTELGSEKPSEDHEKAPDEQVPSVSEVSPSSEKSGGKKEKLMNGKAKLGLKKPKKKSKPMQEKLSYEEVEAGAKLQATVKCCKDRGVLVALSKTVSGHIDYLMLDKQLKNPEKKYRRGLVLDCRVLHVMPERKIIKLTSKKHLVNSPFPVISEYDSDLVGTVSEGYIVKIISSGLLVAMYNNVKGFVPKSLATSEKETSLDTIFTIGQVVKFCITKVNPATEKMTLTLRIDKDLVNAEEETEDEEGETIGENEETKKKAETIDQTKKIEETEKQKGMKRKKEEECNIDTETTEKDEGTEKKKKKKKKGKVEIEEPDHIVEDVNDTAERGEETDKKKGKKRKKEVECSIDTETTEKEEGKEKKKKKKDKKGREKNVEDEEVKDANLESDAGLTSKKPCLSVGTGFVWDVPDSLADKEQSSESEEEEEDEAKKKKTKKMTKAEREAMAKQEEQRLHELERARLDKDRLPQTAMDYEELLQTSPNSSAVWIQFISFHLESAEMEKAKAVARRALQVINMREEQERLNIWTVILRLEVLYGTAETVQASYREALATNDEQQVHLAMAMVYAENDKIKDASNIYYIMTKKFGQVLDVWIKAGIFFYRNKKFDEARKYMDRALIALDKKHHVELINRFGQLEFRFGEAERGRTMFESLLSNYPKRIDIWSVYVDLLTKNGDIEGARTVLERMTGLKLKIRKMRGIFKKFLDFEKTHGTPQRVQAVKKQVEDFVAAAISKE
ncbi:protein RRP5 homolog isoform X2 [Penaeus chinensis]|uniref:protein RRP5 homolog isoform X2 n=1 Tax=Penaeus chinensis TaxID=139456 RepID=UPI001FB58162|nr:protein RRP5 homolog isoform X2 [Penaeus chinensis]